MIEKTFTPGPWKAIGGINGETASIWIMANDPSSFGVKRDLVITSFVDAHPIPEHNKRRVADFKLMALAPEMFDMLEKILIENPDISGVKELLNKVNSK